MRRALSLFAIFSSSLGLYACGASGETGEEFDYGIDAAAFADAGKRDGSTDGGKLDGSTDGATTDGSADGSSADASTGDAATDAGTVDAGPPDAGLPDLCATPTACASGASLGSVAGDTGSDFLQATGTSSKWLLVRVTENDSSLFSRPPLRARFTLIHNPNTRFDLFVYKAGNNGGGTRNCSSVSATGARGSTTNLATASLSWDDTTGFGGNDDSANVMVEVRHVSGPCGVGREWQLSVDGNAQ
jgi:hypothetical protein